ncbi:MAG: triple tyrosine motif-containing protein [Bacteroidota bacterium]
MKKSFPLLLILSIFPITCLFPQILTDRQVFNHGKPLMHNYTPNEYGGHIQNWSVVQDKRGVMYFANGGSILEYDGKEWRMVHYQFTRSLAMDDKGVIYAGGFNDFGYLKVDSSGNLLYTSLKDKIDKKHSEFSDIWKIHIIDDKVYFLADDRLFIYKNDEIKVIVSKTASFDMSFVVNGEYFIYLLDKGLTKLTGDSLKLIVSKEEFNSDKIMTILPFRENKILIGTRKTGLFLLEENDVYPYKTNVDEFLKKNQIISGIILSDQRYTFGTITGGLIITDNNGNFSRIINNENDLQDNTVIDIFEDRDGGLFLALFNGITRVEINSPFLLYDDKTGLQGSVYAVIKHNNTVYASTSQGVFYLNDNEITNKSGTDWIESPTIFRKIPQINTQCYSFTPFSKGKNNKSILVCSNLGIFEIINDPVDKSSVQGKLIFPYKTAVFVMHRSDFDTSRVLMGLYDGFGSIRYNSNEWIYEGKIESVKENTRSIVEDKNGNIWLGTTIQGVLLLSYDFTEAKTLRICRFDSLNGLPQGEIWIKDFDNTIRFATLPNGIYKIQGLKIPSAKSPHESTSEISCINSGIKFIPDTAYRYLSNRKIFPYATNEDCAGNIWSMRKEDDESWTTGVVFKNDTEWAGKWFSKPFDRVKDISSIMLYPENDRIIWFGGGDKLYRYDHNIKQYPDRKFCALIRVVISGNDSILFFGTNYDTNKSAVIKQPEGLKPLINYSDNSLSFEYSSPFYDDEWLNQFQYFLDGFDDDWSQWSSETKKEYTNLPEGTYFFRVRAKIFITT